MPPIHPDAIADCVLAAFHALPAKCKPRKLADGRREWVPLAGVVLSRDHDRPASNSTLTCAALATGMKCLPYEKLPLAKGNVLHDWHAEVLAIRGFNRWLVDECADLARKGVRAEGQWVRWRRRDTGDSEMEARAVSRQAGTTQEEPVENGGAQGEGPAQEQQPFEIHDDVSIHVYCSQAPCGDASMELTMAAQDDATPWTSLPPADGMLGRGNFDRLGVVRRKPARPDAPLTLSKSCSDKLAMKQCTTLLSGVVSALVHPGRAYLRTLVLPEWEVVPAAVERAFGREGRLRSVAPAAEGWSGGYRFEPFDVLTTSRTFEYSKPTTTPESESAAAPSNLSAFATANGKQEILINGVLQGRKQFDPKGASCASRRRMWDTVRQTADLVDLPPGAARDGTYADLKTGTSLSARQQVKHDVRTLALQGWKANIGDEDWRLDD